MNKFFFSIDGSTNPKYTRVQIYQKNEIDNNKSYSWD